MPAKKLAAVIALVLVLSAGAGFAAAWVLKPSSAESQARSDGPMAQLTDEERAKLRTMTDEERQQFFEQKFGSTMPALGTDGAFRGPRGGTTEGTVIETDGGSITLKTTAGGSQTLYTDSTTVVAYQKGAQTLQAGSHVMVLAQPDSSGDVATAKLVVVLAK
ncbi:hypothetical protein MX659_00345 [Coriobacteriia bacterium Es71-Z0120]|uniref:hypothetical protein n=1 Tax=Parvivirga hydrogeniphila TaxID=2939460 RepID=UPI002260DFE9|nr:hypothetical protein [Parvivirga hydrogeniphila]MCL4078065.1 hypothetical protein [Parvivirga hydrogeniphila]